MGEDINHVELIEDVGEVFGIEKIWEYTVLNNDLRQIILALGLFFLIRLLIRLFNKYIIKKIHAYRKKPTTHTTFWTLMLKAVEDTPKYVLLTLDIIIPLKVLTLPHIVDQVINGIFLVVIIIQLIRMANVALVYVFKNMFKDSDHLDETKMNAIQLVVKIVVRVTGLLLILINLGVEITPLIASLGVGGIAVAFALQNILSDLFSSFSIFVEKPFKVGDFIIVNDNMGIVKDITFKSTFITALTGQELVIPNRKVMDSVINNYTRMKRRRIVNSIGVTYETGLDKLKLIPTLLKEAIDEVEDVTPDRINLSKLADFSINFEYVYYVEVSDYASYMAKNEEIINNILERFKQHKISIAYPTQVVYTPTLESKSKT